MKQEIVSREKLSEDAGRTKRLTTLRTLKCGHVQVEPHGSKAKDAKFAQCKECDKLLVHSKALRSICGNCCKDPCEKLPECDSSSLPTMEGPTVTTLDPVD